MFYDYGKLVKIDERIRKHKAKACLYVFFALVAAIILVSAIINFTSGGYAGAPVIFVASGFLTWCSLSAVESVCSHAEAVADRTVHLITKGHSNS